MNIAQLRRIARKGGWRIDKSRSRTIHSNNLGGFQLVDQSRNYVVWGSNYELTLLDLEDILKAHPDAWEFQVLESQKRRSQDEIF